MGKRKSVFENGDERETYIFSHGQARIYLSPYKGYADNKEWLRERNIRYIVNVTKLCDDSECVTLEGLGQIRYCKIPAEDRCEKKQVDVLLEHIPRAIRFLRDACRQQCGILFHCIEGRSRSPTVLIAFMIACGGYDLASAHCLLQDKVPNLLINIAFMNMLREYEVITKDLKETTLPMMGRSAKKRSIYYRTSDYQTT